VQNLYPFAGQIALPGGSEGAVAWSLTVVDSREEALAQAAGADGFDEAPGAGRG